MLSTVDMSTPVVAMNEPCVAVTKQRIVSNGVSVSRLHGGGVALSVHEGDHRAIVELTPDELRVFLERLTVFAAAMS
jgi:hypothetical protein